MKKKHLLVVDDEKSLRAVLEDFLGRRGYRVTAVETASQGIALLNEEPVDLAIVDLVLPSIDGLELLEIIRTEHPRLPVIVFTGVGYDEEILQEARKKGASSFVTKGLPMANLLMEIHRLLNYRGSVDRP